jgi:3-oxoadipate enol-lactonase
MSGAPPTPVELHARVEGTGPSVVLLHGLGADHSVWNGIIGPLSKSYRVIAPDLRGHGRSPAPSDSTGRFPEMEGDLLSLIDRHHAGPVHLVGLSAGGFLALQTAVDHPQALRSLTAIGSAAHCDAHTRAVAENWSVTYREEGFDAYFLRLLKDLYYPDWVEAHLDYADHLREQMRHQELSGATRWGESIAHFDLRHQLGRVRLPALIIQGMDDQVIDPPHARLLRQTIPGAQLRLLPQTGHLVPVERPEELTVILSEWFERASGPSPGAPANPSTT